MRSVAGRGTGTVLRVAATGLAVVFAVAVLARGEDRAQSLVFDVGVYNAVYVCAALSLLLRPPGERLERWGWRVLGAGMFATVAGDLYYAFVLDRLADPPYPSPADAAFLLWFVFAYVAVGLLIRSRVTRFLGSLWLDGLVAGLGVAALVAALVVDRVVELTGGSTSAVAVNVAYPAANLLLVIVVVVAGVALGAGFTRWLGAVVVGLLVNMTADVINLLELASGTYVVGGALDLLWLTAVVVLAWAPTLRSAESPGPAGTRPRWHGGRLVALPVAAGLASVVIIGMDQVGDMPIGALALADASILAAIARSLLTLREVRAVEGLELVRATAQARTDDLTGLPNRRALLEEADSAVPRATPDSPLSVLLLDLDRFKEINDSLGHTGGDRLLRMVAERVVQSVRPGDVVARLGGDEFAVLLPGVATATARMRAEQLVEAFAAPFELDGIRLHVDVSIGVASAPSPAATRSDLLRLADVAMYEAKRGRRRVAVAGPGDDGDGAERLRVVDQLISALDGVDPETNGVLLMHLQPQVGLVRGVGAGAACGVEALVRWQHPVRGLVPPGAFLPLAESAGLLGRLATVVLELSLEACRQWWATGSEVPVSVNLSATDLDLELPSQLAEALARHRLPARALVVELTEDMLMSDPQAARVVLQRIRELGVGVSIDDYGTGYSSLAYLRDLPADELKLDRTFTADLTLDGPAAAIVRTTVDLAHSLGMRLVAEGIEDDGTLLALAVLGCDVGQGYGIARPMPVSELLPWLRARQRPVALVPRSRGRTA